VTDIVKSKKTSHSLEKIFMKHLIKDCYPECTGTLKTQLWESPIYGYANDLKRSKRTHK
jgi:hypothetical protein